VYNYAFPRESGQAVQTSSVFLPYIKVGRPAAQPQEHYTHSSTIKIIVRIVHFSILEKEINPKTMITDCKEIQHSALELDENHRAELAKKLIDSLDQRIDDDIEQA
jgi:hypothetical protein